MSRISYVRRSGRCINKCFFSSQSSNRMYDIHGDTNSIKPIKKVLVANRGEIACRVIRTARRMGIETVALYSDVDGPFSLHASMADEKYKIGTGPTPAESYLRAQEIIDIADKSGAQAIHPGYGFLSENKNFASLVTDAGLVFIGPPASAIGAMGSKAESKALMMRAGVICTPGYHGANQENQFLLHQAKDNVGFPILIKATKGGGGKGMRVVWNESEFLSSLESCRRESLGAFGDTDVILEKFLLHPRHIEIQIMADNYGNVLYLHERDCSLQRRHQKVIEEAPASDLPLELRQTMGEMAVKAAKAVGYRNAGTVEFLLDTQSPTPQFYFCEMNTRLQVEHPITEMITGFDLVEWQLKIASGYPLSISHQRDIPCIGHAMEARIYAENIFKQFLPATGHINHHIPPVTPNVGVQGSVRVDTGIRSKQDITVYYDPMISKLIVHGKDRETCRQELLKNLKRYQIAGVGSNIPFLIECADHATFKRAGAINTGFLETHANEIIDKCKRTLNPLEQSICALVVLHIVEKRVARVFQASSTQLPWSNISGSWRIGGSQGRHKRILQQFIKDKEEKDEICSLVCVSNRNGSYEIKTSSSPDEEYKVLGILSESGKLDVTVNGSKRYEYSVAWREDVEVGKISVNLWSEDGHHCEMDFEHPLPVGLFTAQPHPSGEGRSLSAVNSNGMSHHRSRVVKSPMPGRVTKIFIQPNDLVVKDQLLLVVEAMKMEHTIKSPTHGRILRINSSVGSIVNDGDIMVMIDRD